MTTSRRLHFVVGTSLLGASLAFGCTPKVTPDEDLHVNPGPNQPEPVEPNVEPVEQPEPEAEAGTETPDDKPDTVDVNPGPQELPPEPAEPKYVNTRPNTN